jgi:hypothetical protein
MKKIIVLLIFLSFSCVGLAKQKTANSSKPVVVEIDFNNGREAKRVEIVYNKNLTAMEALQKAAEVRTHPVGSYVFVIEIDQVTSERGEMAWYYTINGKKPKLAIEQPVKPGDIICWQFKEDVCSKTVDGLKK